MAIHTKKPPPVFRRRLCIVSLQYLLRLRDLDIYCVHASFAALCVERDFIAFANIVDQTSDVNKNFLVGGAVYDKSKTFGLIEELYGSIVHCKKTLKIVMWQLAAAKIQTFFTNAWFSIKIEK